MADAPTVRFHRSLYPTASVLRAAEMPWARPPKRVWPIFRGMLAQVGGRRRLQRALEPA